MIFNGQGARTKVAGLIMQSIFTGIETPFFGVDTFDSIDENLPSSVLLFMPCKVCITLLPYLFSGGSSLGYTLVDT